MVNSGGVELVFDLVALDQRAAQTSLNDAWLRDRVWRRGLIGIMWRGWPTLSR